MSLRSTKRGRKSGEDLVYNGAMKEHQTALSLGQSSTYLELINKAFYLIADSIALAINWGSQLPPCLPAEVLVRIRIRRG